MELLNGFDDITALWAINCICAFVLCLFCAGVVIPQILLISYRRKLFDEPDGRKIHQGAVPRLGGLAFKPVVLLVMTLILGINEAMGHTEVLRSFSGESCPLAFAFCSVMVLYLVGMADDLVGVRYRAKFAAEALCGVMLIASGVWIDHLCGLLWMYSIPKWFGYPLTFVIVIFFINAVNMIDGVDGLASGLCSVVMLFYGAAFLMLHQYVYALIAFCTLGVLVPFFYYNVFGDVNRHKKIFMGDTGSLTIGMIVSLLSIKLLQCDPDQYVDSPNFFALAFAPLAIPSYDVLRVYFRRLRNRKNPFKPDKTHIHHKLLSLGLSKRAVMVWLVAASALIGLITIVLSLWVNITILHFGFLIIWVVFNMWLSRKIAAKKASEQPGEESVLPER